MIRWVIATALLLMVPLAAMVFRIGIPDPGSGTEAVNWGPGDFVAAGVLLLGAGLTFEFATRRAGHIAHRLAAGVAVVAALLLVWINLAVGIIGSEDNPANLMYAGVIAVGLLGAAIARFQPHAMALAMFATAGAHALVAVIAVVAGFAPTLPLDAFFVGLWVLSALLFRQAAGVTASRA